MVVVTTRRKRNSSDIRMRRQANKKTEQMLDLEKVAPGTTAQRFSHTIPAFAGTKAVDPIAAYGRA
jgi:hypothetical protein